MLCSLLKAQASPYTSEDLIGNIYKNSLNSDAVLHNNKMLHYKFSLKLGKGSCGRQVRPGRKH